MIYRGFRVVGFPFAVENGFTLIELIIVIVVAGVLAVAAITMMPTGYDVTVEAETLKSHLRYAQFRAMRDVAPTTWGIALTANSYTLYRDVSGTVTNPLLLPGEISNSATHNLPGGVSVTTGTGTSVGFNEWGSPGNTDVTIVLSQGGRNETITVTRITGYIP
jgi:MSHA pilin protein MshC